MSFRRVGAGGAAVVLAVAAIVAACGDTTNVPDIIGVGNEAGGGDAVGVGRDDGAVDDGRVNVDGGGADDAADGAIGCGVTTSPTSDRCQSGRRCTSEECGSALAFTYQCESGLRPNIEGCKLVALPGEAVTWCCPAQCVRNANRDGPGCKPAYDCPSDGDGGHFGSLPSPVCEGPFLGSAYCCP